MTEPFGFTVERETRWDFVTERLETCPDSWIVRLPHHCCPFDITDGIPHVDAVAELERFIAEAKVALEALKAEREIGGES